jgi:hypothetical protein
MSPEYESPELMRIGSVEDVTGGTLDSSNDADTMGNTVS